MYNLYHGNSGKMERVEEQRVQPPQRVPPQSAMPMPQRQNPPQLLDRLMRMLPRGFGALENEDLILMLILYLMYKESGDEELLMILGGMLIL